ncbi:hypothetical protein OWV82_012892, partial [Melia azedarach]
MEYYHIGTVETCRKMYICIKKMIMKNTLCSLIYLHDSVTASCWMIIGMGILASLNIPDILNQDIIMFFHFFNGFPTHSPGNILPAVRGFLVINGQGSFELFVLFNSPGG